MLDSQLPSLASAGNCRRPNLSNLIFFLNLPPEAGVAGHLRGRRARLLGGALLKSSEELMKSWTRILFVKLQENGRHNWPQLG